MRIWTDFRGPIWEEKPWVTSTILLNFAEGMFPPIGV